MKENSDKGTGFSQKQVFEYNGKKMNFTRPVVMGILNLTPDSFYVASRKLAASSLKPHPLAPSPQGEGKKGDGGKGGEVLTMERGPGGEAMRLLAEGAAILDLGAVSTRPGAPEVDVQEEKRRLLPALKDIRRNFPEAVLSIDTYRAEIARIAAEEGADMINDISGGTFDPNMLPLVARLGIPYVIMHIQGTPQNMQANPRYDDVAGEVFGFLLGQAKKLEEMGHHQLILDPGFGFGKTVEHNFELLNNLERLTDEGYPVLAGLSRKSMINRVLGTKPDEALNGTTVLNTIALLKGASILRVHDVRAAAEAVKLVEKLTANRRPPTADF